MPGDEILEFGPGKQPLTHDVEPARLDVQGRDEEPPPPRPRRVKVRLGAVVGVVSGLLVGAAAWNAVDNWRGETAARRATALSVLFEEAGPRLNSSETQWATSTATFRIFNAGEHPVTIEGITLAGWEPAVADQRLSREIDPGTSAIVRSRLAVDCAKPGSRPATEAVVDVRTVDGRNDTVNVAVAHGEQLANHSAWICSPAMDVWADLINPEWGDGSLTLALQLHSEREVTVVGVEFLSPAFSVETRQLPVTAGADSQPIATMWRVVDCVAAQNFELPRGQPPLRLFVRLTLDDGTTQDFDVGHSLGFVSLIRLTERSCPSS